MAGRSDLDARLAIDIGGTFTDIVLRGPDRVMHQSKVSTTPADPSLGVVEGVRQLLAEVAVPPAAIREVLHGTTVGSNAILQRQGAATGLITTRGFRDVLEIGRIRMPDMFDLSWDKPKPLVPRRHRLEVSERLAADGSIVTPLDEGEVVAAGRSLQAAGIEAVAVCFINSYRNPAHEERAAALLSEHCPDLLVATSCSVLPEMKEYERTSTTVVNAYLLAVMQAYLARLERGLEELGIRAPLLVMTSNGGMLPARATARLPVLAVASGPAGGVIGAARLGAARQERDVIVFDMGGTTAKAAIIEDGRPVMTSEYEFRDGMSTSSRFIKAGGYMLKVPAIDIAEVGAGGGSIASIDGGGLLTVGPRSAGAVPGPACYGLGNELPTVTDANVELGLVNPRALAGGRLAIDGRLSHRAIERHVAGPLGLSVQAAAHGIRDVANAAMARAVRAVTVERGRDPRDLTLIAFGGNGGIHAPDLARHLGIPRVVVPPLSGVFSALGMLGADVEYIALKSVGRSLGEMLPAALAAVEAELAAQVSEQLAADGYAGERIAISFEADVRHEGQASELTVPYVAGDIAGMRERFIVDYLQTYGYRDETGIELMKVRVIGRGLRGDTAATFERQKIAHRAAASGGGSRVVSFRRDECPVATEIVPRSALSLTPRKGPLLIEEFDSTIVVPPDASAHRDRVDCVVIELGALT